MDDFMLKSAIQLLHAHISGRLSSFACETTSYGRSVKSNSHSICLSLELKVVILLKAV